jgi:hypothetical protein
MSFKFHMAVIKDVEVVMEPMCFTHRLKFRGETSIPMTADDIVCMAVMLIRDAVALGDYMKPTNDCSQDEYAKLRSLTIEQLRDLIWHSDQAQVVLTEKLKEESGIQDDLSKKWDDAMSVVGWINPAPDAAAPLSPTNFTTVLVKR